MSPFDFQTLRPWPGSKAVCPFCLEPALYRWEAVLDPQLRCCPCGYLKPERCF